MTFCMNWVSGLLCVDWSLSELESSRNDIAMTFCMNWVSGLLCVDWSLSELESSRNDLLYELQKQPNQTPTDRDVCNFFVHL